MAFRAVQGVCRVARGVLAGERGVFGHLGGMSRMFWRIIVGV